MIYCVRIYSTLDEIFIFVSTDFSLVKMTSYCLNTYFALNLCAVVVLQFVIIFIANSSFKKSMLDYCFGLSAGSCLCFVKFEKYFFEMISKFL